MAVNDRPRPAPRRGITLIETAVSTVIVGVMLVAALNALGALARRTRAGVERETMLLLAHDLMSEIVQAHYLEPDVDASLATAGDAALGPEPNEIGDGTSRAAFDDVDDYDGWSSLPPVRADGTPIPGADAYLRRVEVAYVGADDAVGTDGSDPALFGALKRITVVVRHADDRDVTLQMLRGPNGSYDVEPRDLGLFVRRVGVRFRLGADAAPTETGAIVLNQVPLGGGS